MKHTDKKKLARKFLSKEDLKAPRKRIDQEKGRVRFVKAGSKTGVFESKGWENRKARRQEKVKKQQGVKK